MQTSRAPGIALAFCDRSSTLLAQPCLSLSEEAFLCRRTGPKPPAHPQPPREALRLPARCPPLLHASAVSTALPPRLVPQGARQARGASTPKLPTGLLQPIWNHGEQTAPHVWGSQCLQQGSRYLENRTGPCSPHSPSGWAHCTLLWKKAASHTVCALIVWFGGFCCFLCSCFCSFCSS